jgi:anti-sigma B factor antagonist
VRPLVLCTIPFCSSPRVVTVVTVTGAIDLATAPQLRSRLDPVPDRGAVVDLAGVTLLAAVGLNVLLDLHDRLSRAGAQLVLLGVPPHVGRMLVATGLDTVLEMTPVVTEALELAAAPTTRFGDRPPIPHTAFSRERHRRCRDSIGIERDDDPGQRRRHDECRSHPAARGVSS